MKKDRASNPLNQDDASTLEAELRQAIQHRDAAQARAAEAGLELQRVMDRARALLERTRKLREEEAGR